MYRAAIRKMQGIMLRLPIGLIRAYQLFISPWLRPSCRFYPSCSEYAKQAFEQIGFIHGSFLITKRLIRCHPLSKGGFDPIPSHHRCKHNGNS